MKHFALILMLIATPLWAVEPDEILDDPALEQRARELSKGLRCLVCQNESIDESNATLARDLRLLVRERLVAGDSDAAAVDYIVARYGEFVLLNPPVTGANWLLWGAGPLMLLLAGGVGFAYLRGRSPARGRNEHPLSEAEQARLDDILGR
ncbi:cytochrome c-type biogenesis protein [Sulfitobacter geojensis]|jgi:cytochrome c-type biogenesis protein CcmH|uniref:Cytochrome c-type biogenesis protein n=1 Tax=Sulfitobacter geojensis TaxID=1342299 RepID=A0AAE3B5A6_9RHOB|nr:cytochrome c-type biogenesis protein [Sulfitobacter geojensis]MBM1687994.1 cytochrome c-type biogenesis protein CcmH [Sulfitobacter geojensis]MBM1692061.1 cytochrome c-type biogenesis protein CcmH [Sulfitobacter geojensis]MBM1704227.1 cytochrome c-type biogenesis protein CcmH [Sulfitobacter geojensis]MBM1708285.1 cytochrome c-type biogenesis protein CcmH [Sulfitobacter geojensis]MBM1712350.1 cytochrome c-type biogenesis protein CcmH [Sulfitobacter geojensis]